MSADFKTVLIRDSKLNDITDQLVYGVRSGAAQSNYQQFVATTASTSQLAFNVTVPSESTVVGREVFINATYTFTISLPINTADNAGLAMIYGQRDAFAAFPLNASFNTLSATINNSNVSINLKDVLPQLIKMMSPRDLQKYSAYTPTYPDGAYYNYSDADGATVRNSPLANYSNSAYDNELIPRGAHPFKIISIVKTGTNQQLGLISGNNDNTFLITCEAEFTEPLFLSPFIFGGSSDYNNQGFVGVNNFSVVANIDSSLSRFWSCGNISGAAPTLALTGITNAKLLVNFLSSQPTQQIKARNIVPYADYPRYITTLNSNIAIAATTEIISQNIQLNQIPDYFIICVRKAMSSLTCRDASTFLAIRSISVNFNNSSGLLSSAQAADLWKISKENGSQQSWYEFYGQATFAQVNAALPTYLKPTGGSVLVLSPANNLSLPAYLSSGSIGQYNFQINVKVFNQSGVIIANPELVIIAVNSGIFTTVAGSSSIYTGVLTKEAVMDAQNVASENTLSSVQYQRLVGGSLGSMISSALKFIPFVGDIVNTLSGSGRRSMSAGAMSGGISKLDSLSY